MESRVKKILTEETHKLTMFETTDGKKFRNRVVAEQHQDELDYEESNIENFDGLSLKELQALVNELTSQYGPDAILIQDAGANNISNSIRRKRKVQ